MDFDLIDAAGTVAILADGGKRASLTIPSGARYTLQIFIDRETLIAPPDFDNFSAEQRILITAALTALPNQTRAQPGSIFVADGISYVVDDDDSQSAQDASIATHIVRLI